MKIFSVYDSKAEAFLPPFFSTTTAVGTRQFEAAANSIDHQFNRFGGDFTLFELGTYDDRTGSFDLYKVHTNLGTALTYQKETQNV